MAIPHTAASQAPKAPSSALAATDDDLTSLGRFLSALALFQQKVAKFQAHGGDAPLPKDKAN